MLHRKRQRVCAYLRGRDSVSEIHEGVEREYVAKNEKE